MDDCSYNAVKEQACPGKRGYTVKSHSNTFIAGEFPR